MSGSALLHPEIEIAPGPWNFPFRNRFRLSSWLPKRCFTSWSPGPTSEWNFGQSAVV